MLVFTQNYFSLLELPEQFMVDEAALASHYRQLQKRVHPDKFASHTEQEQRLAVQFSAHVNQAYSCLRSPLKRAVYLLELRGLKGQFAQMTIGDSAFLLQQMQLREDLMDLRAAPNRLAALEKLQQQAQAMSASIQAEFQVQFNAGHLELAQQHVAKLHFIDKFLADLHQLEDQLLDEV
jgi:molecular chaperone HscB